MSQKKEDRAEEIMSWLQGWVRGQYGAEIRKVAWDAHMNGTGCAVMKKDGLEYVPLDKVYKRPQKKFLS